MSTADQLDNLPKCLGDDAMKTRKDIDRLKKAMLYVHKKILKFDKANPLEKALAAKSRTKVRRAQRIRKYSETCTILYL